MYVFRQHKSLQLFHECVVHQAKHWRCAHLQQSITNWGTRASCPLPNSLHLLRNPVLQYFTWQYTVHLHVTYFLILSFLQILIFWRSKRSQIFASKSALQILIFCTTNLHYRSALQILIFCTTNFDIVKIKKVTYICIKICTVHIEQIIPPHLGFKMIWLMVMLENLGKEVSMPPTMDDG